MVSNKLLRHPALCVSAVMATLILSSCSNSPKASHTKSKQAERTVVSRPAGALPLSAILQAIENAGYSPVVEVEFEKDHWKVKSYKDGQLLQLKVGLMKGEILPNPAPTFDKPLSAVIKAAEDQGYGPMTDVEPADDGAGWDIEAYKGNSEAKLLVEPRSGNITIKSAAVYKAPGI